MILPKRVSPLLETYPGTLDVCLSQFKMKGIGSPIISILDRACPFCGNALMNGFCSVCGRVV